MVAEMWEDLATKAMAKLDHHDYLRKLPKVVVPKPNPSFDFLNDIQTFEGPGPWDRTCIDLEVEKGEGTRKRTMIFSSNDYLALSSHPAVRTAMAKTALMYGMGPRASSMICGHTDYHRRLEATLAQMHKKEDCIICPTGFAANTALLSAMGSIASVLAAAGRRPGESEKIAIFSDALNHASTIDGLRMVERHQEAKTYVYKHNDMNHLESLLANCPLEKKVIFTDSLFSMEGDLAPMLQLVELRNKYRCLLVLDDAHTTLVLGKNGGGIAEVLGIEDQVDIILGALGKGIGVQGGFIACSNKWKQLIQARGRPYIFTTALPVPIIAAMLASIEVMKKEEWRQKLVWSHVKYFESLTKFPVTTPILSLVVGTEEMALNASMHLLKKGFHVTAIRPPAVSADTCRLRVTLSAGHTREDIRRLVKALSECMKVPTFQEETECLVQSRL